MTIKFDELLEALDPSLDKLDDKSTKLKEAWEAEFESAYDDLMNDDSLSEKEKDEALKQLFAEFGFNESLKEGFEDDIDFYADEISHFMNKSKANYNAVCDYIDNELRQPNKGIGELNLRALKELYMVFIEQNDSYNESLDLNEYGELQGSDTIAYDKGWEHYESDDMPADGVWLVKSFETDEGDLEGEIQADSNGVYAAVYKSNGSQVFSKDDFYNIGQAVLTVERVINDRYNHYTESLNESINQDIKLINKELERNNREVSKIGFKTHPFFNDGEIAVYVPNERHANLVKSIVRDVARKYGCDSVVEDDNYKGSILFSFHKNDSYRNIGREESERTKQMFENVIKKYNIDYDTALAFILDKIDKDELEFIISELIKMNNK